jgi:hypothetical protein
VLAITIVKITVNQRLKRFLYLTFLRDLLQKFDTCVQHANRVAVLTIIGQNFGINEVSKHLTFQETRHEPEMRSRLIRQKSRFIKRMNLVSV